MNNILPGEYALAQVYGKLMPRATYLHPQQVSEAALLWLAPREQTRKTIGSLDAIRYSIFMRDAEELFTLFPVMGQWIIL